MSFLPEKNILSFSWLAPSLFCFYPQNSASRYQNVLQVKKHVIYCVSVIWNRWDQCSILLLCYESAPAQPAWKCLYSIWPSFPYEHEKTSVFFALLEVLNLSVVSLHPISKPERHLKKITGSNSCSHDGFLTFAPSPCKTGEHLVIQQVWHHSPCTRNKMSKH